jgi:MoaA/NifB/PqqE/SkfB family radical SAM enzyme
MTAASARLCARETNRLRNLMEYRSGADHLSSLPQYVLVELTQGCNLSCPMCRASRLSIKGRSMSMALFDQIAETVFATAEMIDLRGWGESLLLPHLDRCIARAVSAGAEVRFVTNLAMKAPPIALLADAACHAAVSVDSVDPVLYARLREGAQFDRMQENLRALVAAYTEREVSLDRIVLTCTVTAPGLARLPEIADFAAALGIGEVRLFEVFAEPGSWLSLAGLAAEADAAMAALAQRARALDLRVVVGSRLGTMPLRDKSEAACLHPWSYALFAHDGGVGFCDHLNGPDGKDYILGSLHERSFASIWNGDDWRALRREHASTRRRDAPHFHECAWCYDHRLVDFEDRFAPELTPTLLGARSCG